MINNWTIFLYRARVIEDESCFKDVSNKSFYIGTEILHQSLPIMTKTYSDERSDENKYIFSGKSKINRSGG